ncbi:MAG TPA: helix-turn-helix domain-containing protein [Candidatus Limnocylindrales bacterium]|nr:helix-turn-helix domain-containing protein [Candidatus Limnocylindrales bacterium]
MDDIRIGRILRVLRRRLGLTQAQLAVRAGVSQQLISLIERGHGSTLSSRTLRRVFAAVDARWEPTVSWRGGELDRLLDEDHARLVAETVRRLTALGWEVAVEVTYSEYGERGSVDVLAARPELLAVAAAEIKSDITTLEGTVRKTDEKDRIVRRVLCQERFGFDPAPSAGSSCCPRPRPPGGASAAARRFLMPPFSPEGRMSGGGCARRVAT